MKFTVGKASDTMTTLAENFNWWVTAWCLSLDGPTVAQLGEGLFELCQSVSSKPFSLFHHSNNLIVSP